MTNHSKRSSELSSGAAAQAAPDVLHAQPFNPMKPKPIKGFDSFGSVALQKVHNTRDLGGLPAADGRRIRNNRLMRSGDLHNATRDDLAILMDDHQLAAIFDLRTTAEAKQNPDPILEMPGVEFIHESALPEDEVITGSFADIASDAKVVHTFYENADAYMENLYVKCVTTEDGKRTYARFFQLLLNTQQGAVLWHCTQGKDRTGLAAYFVEYILGVSEEDRIQDYLATNLFMDGWLKSFEEFLRRMHLFSDLNLDIEAYTYASLPHLKAALSAINKEYGSLDAYLEEALGVTTDMRKQLQELYLE